VYTLCSVILIFLFPHELRKNYVIYLPVNKSRCSSTVLRLLDPKYFSSTALVAIFIILLITSSSKQLVIYFFLLYKVFFSSEYLKHFANLLMQHLPSISQSITTLLQELKIFFNIETCK